MTGATFFQHLILAPSIQRRFGQNFAFQNHNYLHPRPRLRNIKIHANTKKSNRTTEGIAR
jgi:hypothetical protein